MVVIISIVIILISIYEIIMLYKEKKKKEIIIYSFFAIFTLMLGIYFFSNPYRESFLLYFLKLLGLDY